MAIVVALRSALSVLSPQKCPNRIALDEHAIVINPMGFLVGEGLFGFYCACAPFAANHHPMLQVIHMSRNCHMCDDDVVGNCFGITCNFELC